MSGHSHWSTIRRKKGAEDAKRGQLFTKLAREIVIAVQEAGGDSDPETNFRLRMAVDKARDMDMPKDNIERAIKRGTGEDKSGAVLEKMTYEGYGPNGIAMIIDVVTDNRNRSVAAVRHALTKHNGSLGQPGAVAWQFDRKGSIEVPSKVDFEVLFEAAVMAGAEDVIEGEGEDNHQVVTASTELHTVSESLNDEGIKTENVELIMVPQNELELETNEAVKTLKLIDVLEELDDVQKVFSNLTITDEAVTAYEATSAG